MGLEKGLIQKMRALSLPLLWIHAVGARIDCGGPKKGM